VANDLRKLRGHVFRAIEDEINCALERYDGLILIEPDCRPPHLVEAIVALGK
jgi:hypothetical protein